MERAKDIFAHLLPDLKLTAISTLVSLPGCQQQSCHADARFGGKQYKKLAGSDFPVSVILAIMEDTELVIWPGSAPVVKDIATRRANAKIHGRTPIKPVTVKIRKGYALVLRQDMAHCGAAYKSLNGRIHLFLDNRRVRRPRDRTFPLKKLMGKFFFPREQ